jgi:hypothetical protein
MRRSTLVAVLLTGAVAIAAGLYFLMRPNTSSVSAAFDNPPAYPGYQWTRQGQPVSTSELEASGGPSHCDWQSATILTIGWPPGTVSSNGGEARRYIRDPNGVIGSTYQKGLVIHARLPADARPTGYKVGSIELYLSPSDEDQAAYLVAPSGVERWPRANPFYACN